jgi:hypothetical protein
VPMTTSTPSTPVTHPDEHERDIPMETNPPPKLTGFDGDPGIVHVTPNVCQDLALKAQLADGLAVGTSLRRTLFSPVTPPCRKGSTSAPLETRRGR